MLALERRRSSVAVIADILRLGEASKTEIMYTANLNYLQLRRYMTLLLKLELLDKVMDNNRLVKYRVTPKGLRLLSDIDIVFEMLKVKEPAVLRRHRYTA